MMTILKATSATSIPSQDGTTAVEIPSPSFDLGNGQIFVGDEVIVVDEAHRGFGKVVDITQDGEATIAWGSATKTVKWRYVSPAWKSEQPTPYPDLTYKQLKTLRDITDGLAADVRLRLDALMDLAKTGLIASTITENTWNKNTFEVKFQLSDHGQALLTLLDGVKK